jgi:hypothetical protein
MTLAIPHQQRLPAAIAALGFLPRCFPALSAVPGVRASLLDTEGRRCARQLRQMLGRPFYRSAIVNTLSIAPPRR